MSVATRALALLMASSPSAQGLPELPTPPVDKSTSFHFVQCVSFISLRRSTVRVSLNGRFRFCSLLLIFSGYNINLACFWIDDQSMYFYFIWKEWVVSDDADTLHDRFLHRIKAVEFII